MGRLRPCWGGGRNFRNATLGEVLEVGRNRGPFFRRRSGTFGPALFPRAFHSLSFPNGDPAPPIPPFPKSSPGSRVSVSPPDPRCSPPPPRPSPGSCRIFGGSLSVPPAPPHSEHPREKHKIPEGTTANPRPRVERGREPGRAWPLPSPARGIAGVRGGFCAPKRDCGARKNGKNTQSGSGSPAEPQKSTGGAVKPKLS